MTSTNTTPIKEWTIYKMVNPEGQIYIGRSSNMQGRVWNYKSLQGRTNSQPFLYESLNKYGFQSHDFQIIDKFDSTLDYAEGKEIFWIRSHMSNRVQWPEMKGLNKTRGGQGSLGASFKGRPSPLKGRVMSDEAKLKMSIAKKGRPSLLKGAKKTLEQRMKMSSIRKGKSYPRSKPSINRPVCTTRQPILILNRDGSIHMEARSKIAAGKFLGIGVTLLNSILKGEFNGEFNDFIIKKK